MTQFQVTIIYCTIKIITIAFTNMLSTLGIKLQLYHYYMADQKPTPAMRSSDGIILELISSTIIPGSVSLIESRREQTKN